MWFILVSVFAEYLGSVLVEEPGCQLFYVDHSASVLEHLGDQKVVVVLLVQSSRGHLGGVAEERKGWHVAHGKECLQVGLVVDVVGNGERRR